MKYQIVKKQEFDKNAEVYGYYIYAFDKEYGDTPLVIGIKPTLEQARDFLEGYKKKEKDEVVYEETEEHDQK